MKFPRWVVILLVFLLLAVGVLAFRWLNPTQPSPTIEAGFRQWFWQHRSLDLIVQMVLVFAGALGIAALLPLEDDDA